MDGQPHGPVDPSGLLVRRLSDLKERIGGLKAEIAGVRGEIGKLAAKIDPVRAKLDAQIETVRSGSIGILWLAVIGLLGKRFFPVL